MQFLFSDPHIYSEISQMQKPTVGDKGYPFMKKRKIIKKRIKVYI